MELSIESADKFSMNDKKVPIRIVAKCSRKRPLKGTAILTATKEDTQYEYVDSDDDKNKSDEIEEEEESDIDEFGNRESDDEVFDRRSKKTKTIKTVLMKKSIDINGSTDIELDMENELQVTRDQSVYIRAITIHIGMVDSHFGFTGTAEKVIAVYKSSFKNSSLSSYEDSVRSSLKSSFSNLRL